LNKFKLMASSGAHKLHYALSVHGKVQKIYFYFVDRKDMELTMIKKLPDSELEIMMIIWNAGEKVTSDYIMERLDKTWVKSTVLNFLSRLAERGFVKYHKEGRLNIYEPIINKEDYLQRESKSFFKKMHDNSLVSLVASLYGGDSISQDDLEELKRFIEEAK